MKLTNHIPSIPSNLFSWEKTQGVIEISDLNNFKDIMFVDGVKVGFFVESSRTQKRLYFESNSELLSGDGEVMVVIFSDGEGLGIDIHVLND